MRCFRPEGGADSDPIHAEFDDESNEIAQITCLEYEELFEVRPGGGFQRENQIYFTQDHVKNHNTIKVAPRGDRHALMSIYERGAQILQMGIFAFMPDPVKDIQHETDEAYDKAGAFMKALAQEYADNNIKTKTKLVEERDCRAKEHNLPLRAPGEKQIEAAKQAAGSIKLQKPSRLEKGIRWRKMQRR